MCDTQNFFFISFYREKAGDTTEPNESLAANADVDDLPAHKPELTVDEQIEDEWGPVKKKKDKKSKVKTDDDEQKGLSTRIYLIIFR